MRSNKGAEKKAIEQNKQNNEKKHPWYYLYYLY